MIDATLIAPEDSPSVCTKKPNVIIPPSPRDCLPTIPRREHDEIAHFLPLVLPPSNPDHPVSDLVTVRPAGHYPRSLTQTPPSHDASHQNSPYSVVPELNSNVEDDTRSPLERGLRSSLVGSPSTKDAITSLRTPRVPIVVPRPSDLLESGYIRHNHYGSAGINVTGEPNGSSESSNEGAESGSKDDFRISKLKAWVTSTLTSYTTALSAYFPDLDEVRSGSSHKHATRRARFSPIPMQSDGSTTQTRPQRQQYRPRAPRVPWANEKRPQPETREIGIARRRRPNPTYFTMSQAGIHGSILDDSVTKVFPWYYEDFLSEAAPQSSPSFDWAVSRAVSNLVHQIRQLEQLRTGSVLTPGSSRATQSAAHILEDWGDRQRSSGNASSDIMTNAVIVPPKRKVEGSVKRKRQDSESEDHFDVNRDVVASNVDPNVPESERERPIPIPSLPQRNYLSKIDLEPPSGGLLHIFDDLAWSPLTLSPSLKLANRSHFLSHKSCTHCKRLKMKCYYPPGERLCKRCRAGNHDCIVEGRRSALRREHLVRMKRKDEVIESLYKELRSPYLATPGVLYLPSFGPPTGRLREYQTGNARRLEALVTLGAKRQRCDSDVVIAWPNRHHCPGPSGSALNIFLPELHADEGRSRSDSNEDGPSQMHIRPYPSHGSLVCEHAPASSDNLADGPNVPPATPQKLQFFESNRQVTVSAITLSNCTYHCESVSGLP